MYNCGIVFYPILFHNGCWW